MRPGELSRWLRRLRKVAADTPPDVHVHVAAGHVLVTHGYNEDACQDEERVSKMVASFLAPRWLENDP